MESGDVGEGGDDGVGESGWRGEYLFSEISMTLIFQLGRLSRVSRPHSWRMTKVTFLNLSSSFLISGVILPMVTPLRSSSSVSASSYLSLVLISLSALIWIYYNYSKPSTSHLLLYN